MVLTRNFFFALLLLRTSLASINFESSSQNVNSIGPRQNLQRSLLKKEVLEQKTGPSYLVKNKNGTNDDVINEKQTNNVTEVFELISEQTNLKKDQNGANNDTNKQSNNNVNKTAKTVKKQLSAVEMGTLDEFLMSTHKTPGLEKEEGYFVFPPVIDFGDQEEVQELPENRPNWPFYAPSYEYNKKTSIPPKMEDEINQTTPKKPTSNVPNLGYKPMRPFYAPNYPLGDRFGVPETSSPSYHHPESTKGPSWTQNRPEDTPEEISTQKNTTPSPLPQKVPELGYKPSRPFYTSGFPLYLTTKRPVIQNEEDQNEISTQKTTVSPNRPTSVPDLNYKPSRPFYASNCPYPVTKWPSNQNEEDQNENFSTQKTTGDFQHFEISTTQKTTTYKVPSLGYKPMRPFYAQGWNGYPRPTTKNPNYTSKNQDFVDKNLNLQSKGLLNELGQVTNQNLSQTELTNDKPKQLLLNQLYILVDFVKNHENKMASKTNTSFLSYEKIEKAINSLFIL